MELLVTLLIGVLYSAGIYLLLRRSLVKLIVGLIFLGNGANMLIFLLGTLVKGRPPVIADDAKILSGLYADPVPQALILTAIVISFGLQAFAIILIKRVHAVTSSDDLDDLNTTEEDI